MQPIPEPYAVQHRKNKIVVGLIGVAFACIVGATFVMQAIDERPYLVFDGDPSEEGRLDGVNLGSLRQGIAGQTFKGPTMSRHALVKAVTVGAHHVEILDAKGNVIVDARVDVPDKQWRAVVTSVPSRRYAVVYAKQQYPLHPEKVVALAPGRHPQIFTVPPSDRLIGRIELDSFDDKLLPLDGRAGRIVTMRICSVDAEGRPTCL